MAHVDGGREELLRSARGLAPSVRARERSCAGCWEAPLGFASTYREGLDEDLHDGGVGVCGAVLCVLSLCAVGGGVGGSTLAEMSLAAALRLDSGAFW